MTGRWDGAALLQPIADDAPCGQNLEDTQLLAAFDAFRLFGQATPLDPAPKWSEIRNSALDGLGRSKDLRLLAHLGTALLRTDGLPAFAEALTIASEWLASYWNETYPPVDEDAILRRNALNCFADQMAVLDGLRRAPLVSGRQGTFSLRDIEIAAGQSAPSGDEARPDAAQIDAAFGAMPAGELTALHGSAAGALAALRRIDRLMRDGAGDAAAPDFEPLASVLGRIERVLGAQLASRSNGSPAEPGDDPADGASHTGRGGAVGAIRSRQDAIRALDAVADYFRQAEPSSPVPLLIDRAKRLVSKDFLEVLADIAPEALGQARAAGGLREGD
jgi:type VI secretion system protein ImpA